MLAFPPFRKMLGTGLLLAIFGWGGLFALIHYTRPTLGPRWLFFFLFVVAVSGTVLPLVGYLNRRFASSPPAEGGVILRQALWVAIFASIVLWMQLGRTLNLAVAVFLAVGFVVIEFLLRLSERSRWKPNAPKDE